MKREKSLKNKRILLIGGIIIAAILLLTGCGKSDDNSKTDNNVTQNQEQNVVKQDENTDAKIEKNETNTNKNNTTNNNKTSNASANNKSATPQKLIVNREGTSEEVTSKEYSSTLGYTMRYASEYFKVSYRDNEDFYEANSGIDCVAVDKEKVAYSKKISTISNYKKTTVNGYEAVYTTRKVEGQAETIYYVNDGKDNTYIITTSCQDNTEYLEGLGKIMNAMVQTFSVK